MPSGWSQDKAPFGRTAAAERARSPFKPSASRSGWQLSLTANISLRIGVNPIYNGLSHVITRETQVHVTGDVKRIVE